MPGRLAGKVAVITGGASGIGAATVRLFAAEGANVVATDLQEDLGQSVAREVDAIFVKHDVADDAQWGAVMRTVAEQHGRLDIVMNNAGIVSGKSIEDADLDSWHKIIGINLTGVMLGCRHAIALMKRNPGGSSGSLINVASTAGVTAIPGDVGYSASKFAVRGVTRSVAVHCARAGYNIRCNAIVPGATETAILAPALAQSPAFRTAVGKMSPLGRIGKPEGVAAMALFLASDETDYCTGADYFVDGGTLAGHPGI